MNTQPPPFRDVTVGALLTHLAAAIPNNEALVYADRDLRLTFAQLEAEARLIARGLMASGVERGERVALWATNVPEWVVLQFALAKIGAVLVTGVKSQRDNDLESDRAVLPLIEQGVRMAAVDFNPKVALVAPELKGFSLGRVQIVRSKISAMLQQALGGGDRSYDVYVSFREDGGDKCMRLELKWRAQSSSWDVTHPGADDRCEPIW